MNKEEKNIIHDDDDEDDDKIVSPGDCIGHWLEGDKSCEICEIQDSCREMTKNLEEEIALKSKDNEDEKE